MEIKWRIWMEKDHHKVFGKGPKDLLLKIDELGSLRQAAIGLNMSYSKAWHLISTLEKSLGITILDKKVGGIDGGSSILTTEARRLIEKYEVLETEIEIAIKKIYDEIF